jgi:hypothetical protein
VTQERVRYHGIEMDAGWPQRIEAAQEIGHYTIGGVGYDRIPYGREDGGPFTTPCHDCGVLPGQFHVEVICDMEECPRCHGQVIACECPYDGDDEALPRPDSQPLIDWRGVLERIGGSLSGFSVFLETSGERRVVPADDAARDVVALAVTWVEEGCPPRKTEEHARRLIAALAHRPEVEALLQINRDPETFVGYYVRITAAEAPRYPFRDG